jgi:hypothetical protein
LLGISIGNALVGRTGRSLVKVENDDGRLRLRCTHGVSDMRSP